MTQPARHAKTARKGQKRAGGARKPRDKAKTKRIQALWPPVQGTARYASEAEIQEQIATAFRRTMEEAARDEAAYAGSSWNEAPKRPGIGAKLAALWRDAFPWRIRLERTRPKRPAKRPNVAHVEGDRSFPCSESRGRKLVENGPDSAQTWGAFGRTKPTAAPGVARGRSRGRTRPKQAKKGPN